jgi:hypothetical protein
MSLTCLTIRTDDSPTLHGHVRCWDAFVRNRDGLLRQDLRLLEVLGLKIKETEKLLPQALDGDRRLELLPAIPWPGRPTGYGRGSGESRPDDYGKAAPSPKRPWKATFEVLAWPPETETFAYP